MQKHLVREIYNIKHDLHESRWTQFNDTIASDREVFRSSQTSSLHQEEDTLNYGQRHTRIHVHCYIISNSYTMVCPPVRGDNSRALASGLSYVQGDKHGITILYHLHQCIPCTK